MTSERKQVTTIDHSFEDNLPQRETRTANIEPLFLTQSIVFIEQTTCLGPLSLTEINYDLGNDK